MSYQLQRNLDSSVSIVTRLLSGQMMNGFWFLVGIEDRWGDQDVDGRIILRWIFRKWGAVGTGSSWFRIAKGGGRL